MGVRHSALRVIQLVLAQGLVHPVQIVPYLVCMSTDTEDIIAHSADKQLQDIEKKYPGFIGMKAMQGFRLSYRLHSLIQTSTPTRGFRAKEGEQPGALNGFLYSIMRSTKQHRRAVAFSLLKQFEEQAVRVWSVFVCMCVHVSVSCLWAVFGVILFSILLKLFYNSPLAGYSGIL